MPRKKRSKARFGSGLRRKGRRKGGASRRRVRTSRRSSRARRNPGGVVIGDSALELRYEGGKGKRSKGMRGPWKHEFESDDVQVIGKKDGTIELRSKSGARLWDVFEV